MTLNIGCLATYAGVYIEKGMGAHHPGPHAGHAGRDLRVLPDARRSCGSRPGIFALGFLVFTLMLKVAVPISLGEFRLEREAGGTELDRLPLQPQPHAAV